MAVVDADGEAAAGGGFLRHCSFGCLSSTVRGCCRVGSLGVGGMGSFSRPAVGIWMGSILQGGLNCGSCGSRERKLSDPHQHCLAYNAYVIQLVSPFCLIPHSYRPPSSFVASQGDESVPPRLPIGTSRSDSRSLSNTRLAPAHNQPLSAFTLRSDSQCLTQPAQRLQRGVYKCRTNTNTCSRRHGGLLWEAETIL